MKIWILLLASPLLAYELSVAAIFRDEAPYFKEWIEYHRLVGVDHFWLYDDKSGDNWQEILTPYIEQGIVEVIEVSSVTPLAYPMNQIISYRDALLKAKGQTKWLAFIDLDEFLLPLEESTVSACLDKHFSQAAGVFVNWRNFGTGGVYLEPYAPILTRLTACSVLEHPRNAVGKSIIRPDLTLDIWNPHFAVLESNSTYLYGDAKPIARTRRENAADLDDLAVDGQPHSQFLVLNHYNMRDENYYQKVRLPRAKAWGVEPALAQEIYEAYNLDADKKMVRFLQEKHPREYSEFWNGDLEYIREKYYWLEDHPMTVGVYLSQTPIEKEQIEKALSFFPEESLFVVCSETDGFPHDRIFFLEGESESIQLQVLDLCKHKISISAEGMVINP